MALLQIPVSTDSDYYDEKVALDGVMYVLAFHWNERMELWVMDIKDTNGGELLMGLPLLADGPVNGSFIGTVPGAPLGAFYIVDEAGLGRVPDHDNFGNGVTLVYSEA